MKVGRIGKGADEIGVEYKVNGLTVYKCDLQRMFYLMALHGGINFGALEKGSIELLVSDGDVVTVHEFRDECWEVGDAT